MITQKKVKISEPLDSGAGVRVWHDDGTVTGIMIPPDGPVPAPGSVCSISHGLFVFEDESGKTHHVMQHDPTLQTMKKAGEAIGAIVYHAAVSRPWLASLLSSEITTSRVRRIVKKGEDIIQEHCRRWWEGAPDRSIH